VHDADTLRAADVRVLIVDDHPRNRALLAEVVEATAGFTAVGTAASGEEALGRLGHADLVLMDVRMPGGGGVAAARAMARLPGSPHVILVSGDDRPEIAADPAAHGAVAFLRKELMSTGLLRRTWARIILNGSQRRSTGHSSALTSAASSSTDKTT
jgi:CheY-like chemotaxis protein